VAQVGFYHVGIFHLRSNHNSVDPLLLADVEHFRDAKAFPGFVAGEHQVVCQLRWLSACEIHDGSHAETIAQSLRPAKHIANPYRFRHVLKVHGFSFPGRLSPGIDVEPLPKTLPTTST
jgi:hypothetical protein